MRIQTTQSLSKTLCKDMAQKWNARKTLNYKNEMKPSS